MFFDRGHPCFRNLNTTIPVDAIRVKSYFDSLFDPASVPVRISIQIRLWPVRGHVQKRQRPGYEGVVYPSRVL